MSQKYQNEKSPIVYGVKKPKTLRKVQKMTVLQAWEIYKTFLNTLYNDPMLTHSVMKLTYSDHKVN